MRLLLAIADAELAGEVADLAREDPDLEIVQTAVDVGAVSASLGREEADVVLLHEGIAPLPVMELARDLTTTFPGAAFILIVEEATPELLRSAIQAGARDVLTHPFTLEELRSSVTSAAEWARAAQSRQKATAESIERVGGATIAVGGAKGGVGTTTLATHLAMSAAQAGRSTCLVDFDLQAGDVRGLFDVPHRRNLSDLIDVAAEVSGAQLMEALYRHESGLSILLSPEEGEAAEEIGAEQARGLIGAVKFAFEVVVIDLGTVVNDATAVAVELADEALVVTTPDVPALRAANRLISLWKRLQVRDEGSTLTVLNRASRRSEVQPDLARRILIAPLLDTAVPADFRALEAAINTGVPARLADGALRSALDSLAVEMGLVPEEPRQSQGRRSLLRSEAGQVSAELVGMTALIVTVILMLWQIALVGYTFVLADHAAREGARAAAVNEDAEDAALEDVPGAWREDTEVEAEDESVEVRMDVPVIVPGLSAPFALRAREGVVDEDG